MLEPIKFRCDHCHQVSNGVLDFTYDTETIHTREWILRKEYEFTDGVAACEHCRLISCVWPKVSVDKIWTRRQK